VTTVLEVLATPDELAEAAAGQLVAHLAADLARRDETHLCLTGGSIAARIYRGVAARQPSGLAWERVHLWWGDERFVPADHADRNDRAAREALGEEIWQRVVRHPMPASDGGLDLDAAAAGYAEELGDTAFGLCLLGVGPDGHVASLFPDHPSSATPGTVIAVRNSPKPPPERISLTREVIDRSAQVWLTVAGQDKADAVAAAQEPGSTLPAATVSGRDRTVWIIDRAAASGLAEPA